MNSKPTNQPPEGITPENIEGHLNAFRDGYNAAPTVIQPLGVQWVKAKETPKINGEYICKMMPKNGVQAVKKVEWENDSETHAEYWSCFVIEWLDESTPPPQPEDALAGKYADKMIDLGWRDNTDKDVIISDFKSGYSAKPDLINLKKIVENAHMAGQRNAGIDPSYHAALHYYNSEIKDVASQSSTDIKGLVIKHLLSNESELDKPYMASGGIKYTKKELALEIKYESKIGMKVIENILALCLDMLSRGKGQSSTSEEERDLWEEVSNLLYEFRIEQRFDMNELLSTYKISKR